MLSALTICGGCDHLWWSNVVLIPANCCWGDTDMSPDHMSSPLFLWQAQHSSPSHQASVNHSQILSLLPPPSVTPSQQKFASSYLPSWHWGVSNIPILNGLLFLFETVVISAPYPRVSLDDMASFWDEGREFLSFMQDEFWPVIQLRVLV